MAKLGLKHTSDIATRDKYTKVAFELGMVIDGREIPNASVLGAALEEAVKLIQDRITESYQVVPPRAEAPVPVVPVVPQPQQPQPVAPMYHTAKEQPVVAPVNTNPAQGQSGLGFPPGYQPNQG